MPVRTSSDPPTPVRVDVIIPALDEERSIGLVLDDIPRPPVRSVIVVDNGCRDRTAEIAAARGAIVVREERRGYGAACLRGLAALAADTDIVVFVDADYSDHPDELPALIEPIIGDRADLVIGTRMLGRRERGALPPQALWGNRLACLLMRVFWGARHTDLGPFRAVRRSALERLAMADRDFGWTIEMQIKARRAGLRVEEVPVSYRRRVGASKISGTVRGTIRAGSKILWTVFRWRFFPPRR